MGRIEKIGDCTLMLGDCLELLPTLGEFDVIVSDPPYGMAWNVNTTRFSGGHNPAHRGTGRNDNMSVWGDDKPFDPAPFLSAREVVLWGSNHYAERLPVGTTLVWIKRLDPAFGTFLSDAEVAWQKGGHGVYCHRDLSMNAITTNRVHPTQKPVGVMLWCVSRTTGATILDPFMGSGTTGVACVELGRKFVGIEIDPVYFDTACRRIEQAVKKQECKLPGFSAKAKAVQATMF